MESQINEVTPTDNDASNRLTYRVLNGLFWTFSGTGVRAFLRLVILVILARLLTPEAFGVIGAASIVLNFSVFFFEFGISSNIERRPELEEKHLRTSFTIFSLMGLVIGAIVVITAPLASRFFNMAELTPVLQVIAVIFPIQGMILLPAALIKRELRFDLLSGVNIISYALGNGLIGITLALLGFGVWSLVWATIAQVVISGLLLLYLQPYPKSPQLDREAMHELLYFGSGFTLGRFLNYVAENGDNAVVGRWLGADALGFYSRAYQLLVFPVSLFGSAIKVVLLPSMAKVQRDPERLLLAYRRGVSLIAFLFLPVSVAAVIIAPETVLVLLGPHWAEAIAPFQILAAGIFFRASYKISDAVTQATGAVYRRAWCFGLYAVLAVVGALIGQNWGLSGVAIGVLIALAINFILITHVSLALVGMSWRHFLIAHIPAALLAAATLIVLWPVTVALRSWEIPALLILVAAGLLTIVTQLGLLYLIPQFLLGQDGKYMVETLTGYIGLKLGRLGRMKPSKLAKHI